MSRTIRNKGLYLFHIEQLNNPLGYIDKPSKRYYNTRAMRATYVEYRIKDNIETEARIEVAKKERHRDGFPVTHRWKRWIEEIPRKTHKLALKKSVCLNEEFTFDDRALRKRARAIAWAYD
ncbi:hypothetical protein [Erwinia phage FBB1]|nr:hypothetical protein [Erwinia phage FBB1]